MKSLYLALIALSIILGSSCSSERAKQQYLDKGNQHFAEGKYHEAILAYRKSIQKDVRFGEAHYRLALTELALGRPERAILPLQRATSLMPQHEQAKVKLADIYLSAYAADPRADQYRQEAAALARKILAGNPESFDGLRLEGQLAMQNGDSAKALDLFEQANRIKPMQPEVVVGLTHLLIQAGQFERGEQLALRLIADKKDFLPIYDILYVGYMGAKRLSEAESLLKRQVENAPQSPDPSLKLAAHYGALNRIAEMQTALQHLLQNPSRFPEVYTRVGDFYALRGQPEEAIRYFEQGARAFPNDKAAYQKKITNILMAQGKRGEASDVVKDILKAHPNDKDARAARATLLLESRKPENIEAAVKEFETLTNESPENAAFRYMLGRAHQARGSFQEAHLAFRQAIRNNRDFLSPRVALAELSLQQLQFDDALEYAKQILALNAQDPKGRLLHAAALQGLGNTTAARSELERLLKEMPQYRDARLQLGLLSLADKKYKAAEEIFTNLYQNGGTDIRPLNGLAEVYLALNAPAKALQLVDGEVLRRPDWMEARLLLARTAVRAGNSEIAVAQYKHLISINPQAEDLRLALAEFYFRGGEAAKAIETLERAIELNPRNARLITLVGSLIETTGQMDKARKLYHNALEMDPQNAIAMNNLAYNLAETGGDLDRALELAVAATKADNEPRFLDTLGWIYLKKRMPDSALQIFRNLAEKYPADPTFRFHLASALLAKGDRGAARDQLQAALSRNPSPHEKQKITSLLAGIR